MYRKVQGSDQWNKVEGHKSEYMQEVIGIIKKPNTDRFANWKFKYFVANCAFEDAGIKSVTKENKLVRTKLTTGEMDLMYKIIRKG